MPPKPKPEPESVTADANRGAGKGKGDPIFYTIGHATRSTEELVGMLKENGVRTLVDVRTVPKSRTNPQHNRELFEANLLKDHGINYVWMGKELGGLRKKNKELTESEVNGGWRNDSFHNYADYMQSPEFRAGIDELIRLGEGKETGPTCYMCAESYHRRCHRALISDMLIAMGYRVEHITGVGKPTTPHDLTGFAVVGHDADGRVNLTYPPYDEAEDGKTKKKGGRKKKESAGDGGEEKKSKRAIVTSERKRKRSEAEESAPGGGGRAVKAMIQPRIDEIMTRSKARKLQPDT